MSSDSEIWREVSKLFDRAVELPREEREGWLRQSTQSSKVLRRVIRMLKAEDSNVTFLDVPLESVAPDLIIDSVASTRPTRVGKYLLESEIGRGGMGSVFRGVRDDGQFEHVAAVKLMKAGVASDDLRRRFAGERQILATLNHPNIARLLDGGVTDDGESYFVMEYVEGRPITKYCEDRDCPVEERLRLLIDVCDAVSHAHQKLIVHRDLKPSNILVTETGQVKLLDFGIAKLLDPELPADGSVQTRTGLHLLTPEYATPEQILGAVITTSSDVYQIGLLLFELLTRKRPYNFETRSLGELTRVVLEHEIPRPSTVVSQAHAARGETTDRRWPAMLRGDLDAITLKALRKDPLERYASIDTLSADLRAYLEGRPVTASDGTVVYRARKFFSRYRWPLVAALTFVTMLAGYAITVTVQQRETAAERDRAEHYASFLTRLLSSPDPFGVEAEVDQRDITVQSFLDRSVGQIRDELGAEPRLRADLLGTVGQVFSNLGLTQEARSVLEEALAAVKAANGAKDEEVIELTGLLAKATDDPMAADSLYRVQIRLAERAEIRPGPLTAAGLVAYGGFLNDVGRWLEAEDILKEAGGLEAVQVDTMQAALALYYRGRTNRLLDRLDRADSLLTASLDLLKLRFGADHPYSAMLQTELAAVTEFKGGAGEAERLRRKALETFERRLGANHPTTLRARNDLAILVSKRGRPDEAESIMRRIYDLQRERYGELHHETVGALQNLATFLLKQGKLDKAEPMFHTVHDHYAALLPPEHHLHAFPQLSLTELHLIRQDYGRAFDSASLAVGHLERAFPSGHPLLAVARSRLGAALTGLRRYAEAESSLLAAIDGLEAAEGFRPFLDAATERLINLYRMWGKPERADEISERTALEFDK